MMYAYDDGRNQNHSWGLPVERETRYLYFEYIMIDITSSPTTHSQYWHSISLEMMSKWL